MTVIFKEGEARFTNPKEPQSMEHVVRVVEAGTQLEIRGSGGEDGGVSLLWPVDNTFVLEAIGKLGDKPKSRDTVVIQAVRALNAEGLLAVS